MKKGLVTSIALLLVLGLATGCGCKKKEGKGSSNGGKEGTPTITENKNEGVIKDQEVDGIKTTNTSMVTENGLTKLTVTLTNGTSEDYELNEYKIIVKDKDGNTIKELPGYVGSTIKAGESKTLKASTNADLTNAYSIEYEVIK